MEQIKQIKLLEKKRSLLLKKLVKEHFMFRGRLGTSYRRCGKPNCRCAREEKGHPCLRLVWNEKGRVITKMVYKHNSKWIKTITDNYRYFKQLRRELKHIELELNLLFDAFENNLLLKTKELENPFC
jgi:hypothetical protein